MCDNEWIEFWDIEFNNNENVNDLIKLCKNYVNTDDCFLDINKPHFNLLEKIIYDISKFHFDRWGIILGENKYFIEYWVKNVVDEKLKFHLDCDNNGFTSRTDRNTNENKNNSYYSRPFYTCIIYLNDNNYEPTIVTNVTNKNYEEKNFNNVNINLSFPRKLKHISFNGGKYFHTGQSIINETSNKLIERTSIFFNFWDDTYIIKEKIPYIKKSIFPEELDYISLKNSKRILSVSEKKNEKIIYYDEGTLNSTYFEEFFDNNKSTRKTFTKLFDLIEYSDFKKHDTFILKSIQNKSNFIVLSVASDTNHKGLQYFLKSLNQYDISYKLLGLNDTWNGGNMDKYPGGGQKINLLKEELYTWDTEKLKNTLLLFSDSYDVINVSSESEIIQKYNRISKKKKSILFSAEKYCWPDQNLQKYYPTINSQYKYLNSGGFIGNAYDILQLLYMKINDNDDDQLYFTKIFLFDNIDKNGFQKIKLDYNCEIFQTLNGTSGQDIYFYKNRALNNKNSTIPCFIHGNGSSKEIFYNIAKYIL
jgi:hypothetical protein